MGETRRYLREQAHAGAENIHLPNPVIVVELGCTVAFVRDSNRLVIHGKCWFFGPSGSGEFLFKGSNAAACGIHSGLPSLQSSGIKKPAFPEDDKPVFTLDKRNGTAEVNNRHRIRQAQVFSACMSLLTEIFIWLDPLYFQLRSAAIATPEHYPLSAYRKDFPYQCCGLALIKRSDIGRVQRSGKAPPAQYGVCVSGCVCRDR